MVYRARVLIVFACLSFCGVLQGRPVSGRWTDVISHGELLRTGCDERLEVDGEGLQFLFQGVLDTGRAGKPYGQIPWKVGILRPGNQ